MKKLLVIQLGTAAEVLLSTPLLRGLKKALPHLELHCLLHHSHAEVLTGNPFIDHLHQLHFHVQTSAHELLPQAFDAVLNLQPHVQASALLQELGAPVIAYPQKGFKAFLNRLLSATKQVHTAEQYLRMASSLGVQNDGFGLDYFIPRAAEVPYADIPVAHSAGFIALAVNNPLQQPEWQRFLAQLLQEIDHPVILIGSSGERQLAEKLKTADAIKIYNACGKFSQHETADLVRKSKLLIAADPFYIQLAAAFSRPVVWLQVNSKDAPPYYGQHFLQTQSEAVYTTVKPPMISRSGKKQEADEKEQTQWVQQTLEALKAQLGART